MVERPLLVAPVAGPAAVLVARWLAGWLASPPLLAPPALVEHMRATEAAVRQAARAYLAWRERSGDDADAGARVDASARASPPPGGGQSEVDTTTAAAMLGVTPDRVRQLCRAGRLRGRRAGRVWLVPVADIEAYREVRHGRL